MKTLFLVGFLCLSLLSYGQGQFALPHYSSYYDLPGNTFLIAYQESTTTHVAEVDSNGIILWEDSIVFAGGSGNLISVEGITHFLNSDEYVVSCSRIIAFGMGVSDSVAIQFNKFSLSGQQFSLSANDTLLSERIDLLGYKDTSTYLFSLQLGASGGWPGQFETYSLNNNLTLSLIAPQTGMHDDLALTSSYYTNNDTITKLSYVANFVVKKWYDQDMNLLDSNTILIPTTQNFKKIFYCEPLGPDSILILFHGSSSGSPDPDWRFTWTDEKLNPLSFSEFSTPWQYIPSMNDSLPYSVNPFDWAVVINQRIYVLGYVDVGVNMNKVFVYDFNFDPVCEIPVLQDIPPDELLKSLNNNPYYINRNNGQDELYEINVCNFTSGLSPVTEDPEIEIYPNPASDILHIINPTGQELGVILLDYNGRILQQWSTSSVDKQLDISTYQAGMYLIRLRYQDKSIAKKVIIGW